MKSIFTLIIFSVILFSWGCQEETPRDPRNAQYYFIGDVDGEAIEILVTALRTNTAGPLNGGSFGLDTCRVEYGSYIGSFLDDTPSANFRLFNMYNGLCANESDSFPGLFSARSFPFYKDQIRNGEQEVSFRFEKDGIAYGTAFGDQTGSDFSFTKVEDSSSDFGLYQTVIGTINCKVYLENDTSTFLTITNGEFKLQLGSYYN